MNNRLNSSNFNRKIKNYSKKGYRKNVFKLAKMYKNTFNPS